jgi:phosphoserine aminotransferase
MADAKHYGDIYTAWDGQECGYTRMPSNEELVLKKNTRYLHITTNETIGGIRFPEWPSTDVPLVADMSSEFMARPIPWERFELVYGGVQKNLGPSGVTIVFVRKVILADTNKSIARYLRYDVHYDKESLFNTPPVFAIYMVGKVLKWMKAKGGLSAIEGEAVNKAGIVYKTIDNSDGYYQCPVDHRCRSHMNVVFRLPRETLEAKFLSEATAAGLVNLKGHRSVGGCRASLYSAVPMEAAQTLADFMKTFQENNA